jgi:RecF protein
MKRLVVIDGKSVFYRGYYAMPNLSTRDGTPTGGVYGFVSLALEAFKKLQPDYVVVAWDKPKTNIRRRKEIYAEYKAGRKPAPPDFYAQIPILHELLEALGWPLYECDDYEADDIMGTLSQQANARGVESILITSDLDMLQLIDHDKMQKIFYVNDRKLGRLPPSARIPVVLFEPDELRLLSSSPQRRRDFFDGIIARLSPTYQALLYRYSRALLQRNELLKREADMTRDTWENHLFAWDVKFAELAHKVATHRREFITLSNTRLSDMYSDMAGKKQHVSAVYHSTIPKTNYQQTLLHALHHNRNSDALRGYTSVGPHRDDFLVSLDGHPAIESASRGEMRTIMLSYKLLEVKLQENIHHSPPLILMDDVFSELDQAREQHLMQSLKHYQTVITATDLRDELKINATIITL